MIPAQPESMPNQEPFQILDVPVPRLPPEERQRRRTAFRNFRHLTYRSCDATGRRILSMYGENAPFPVYAMDHWWSDLWDARSYGRAYDPSRGFFEQYRELNREVPRFGIMNVSAESCEFSNFVLNSRHCYLVFGCVRSEDCLYGHIVWDSQSCLDTLYAYLCQWCSHSVDIVRCYDVHYSQECTDCRESYFLFDCASCSNCFGCSNLRNAQYCYLNEQLSRAEYERRLGQIFPLTSGAVVELEAQLAEYRRTDAIVPESFATGTEDVIGNHCYESANLRYCFDAKRCESASYCFTVYDVANSSDISFSAASTRFSYECLTVANCERVVCSHLLNGVSDAAYSEFCFASRDLFGCNGLRNAQYCILNRQYSRDDYFAIRERIVADMRQQGEWGEFFPIIDSPFAYNESIAQEYMPLSREEVLARGLRWAEEKPTPSATSDSRIPITIDDAGPEILETTFACAESKKPYRIIRSELEFCKKMRIPLSPFAPDTRHVHRMARRAKRWMGERVCSECGGSVATAHDRAFAERVLCSSCYRAAMY